MKRLIVPSTGKPKKIAASTSIKELQQICLDEFVAVNEKYGTSESQLEEWEDAFYTDDGDYQQYVAEWVASVNPDATEDDIEMDFDEDDKYHFVCIVTKADGSKAISGFDFVGGMPYRKSLRKY